MSSRRSPRTQHTHVTEDTPELQPQLKSAHVMATNTGVRLTCTMAAMIGLFGLFLAWAEKESRVIRRYAVQSAALTIVHLSAAAILLLVGALCGNVPYLGLLVSLTCWLIYIALLIILLYVRIRLMENAWQGRGYVLPLIESLIRRYY